ncbi:MAG: methyltransferase domain-containing protein [Gemmatimonadota bacterium]
MHASRDLAAEYSARARSYADLWAPVLRPMAEPILVALPLSLAGTILDVGTGTGTVVSALRSAAPGARILGVDYATGMLRLARDSGPVLVAAMDAQRLAVAASSVDVVTAIFMLFHLPDPLAGLLETHRVLKTGGTVGVVTWGHDPGLPGLSIWTEELDSAGASPDPRDSQVMQQSRMNAPERLSALMETVGYGGVRVWSKTYRTAWTADALAALYVSCGFPSRRLPSLPAPARAACEQRARSRVAALSEAQRMYEPEILYAVATKS